MRWLLQNNYVHAMTSKLAWVLRRLDRDMRDFSLTNEPLDLNAYARADEPHFFYGSTGLFKYVQQNAGHASNLFGETALYDQRCWQSHRADDLLNGRVEFMTYAELRSRAIPGDFFVRPAMDQKAFAGGVVRNLDFALLHRSRLGPPREQPDDLLLAVSPLIEDIAAEYRFIVLDGEVRLDSRYRANQRMAVSAEVPAEVWKAAAQLAKGWLPTRFTVMDVAVLGTNAVRIVEFNPVHGSGLYAIDPEAFIRIVEEASASPLR